MRIAALLILLAGGGFASGQAAQIGFTYDNPGLVPAKYAITVGEDGTGTFHADRTEISAEDQQNSNVAKQIELYGAFDQRLAITEGLRTRLFQLARELKFFSGKCDYGGHKIAFQGAKKLTYRGTDGSGECAYNWSDDKRVQELTDAFEGMATTIIEGKKLALLLTHERLGLDPEIQFLLEQVKAKRAVQLRNIAVVLQAIQEDAQVIDRIRRKALQLATFAANEP